jgi:lysyl-tRNA synthetase class 1
MLLNLAGVANTDDKDVLWQYLRRYVPGATPDNAPYLDTLLARAARYYVDFVKANKKFRLPNDLERAALADLRETLKRLSDDASAEDIQNEVYESGKRHFPKEKLRDWFGTLYQVLLGAEQGPRMGAFIKLYGRDNDVRLIERALAGEDHGQAA